MKEAKEILYASFDRALTAEEAAILASALAQSPELRKEQEEIQAMRQMLGAVQVDTTNLSQQIMQAIAKKPAHRIGLTRRVAVYLPRIAASLLLILGLSLFTIYNTEGTLNQEALIGLEDISAEEATALLEAEYAYNE